MCVIIRADLLMMMALTSLNGGKWCVRCEIICCQEAWEESRTTGWIHVVTSEGKSAGLSSIRGTAARLLSFHAGLHKSNIAQEDFQEAELVSQFSSDWLGIFFSEDPLWKTMVRLICGSTSHVRARLEMPPPSTPCVNTVPVLALHSRKSMSCSQTCKKISSNMERVWSLSKVLFTCALFLIQTRLQFQMEYTGKNPTNIKSRRSKINKGQKPEGIWKENWPERLKQV